MRIVVVTLAAGTETMLIFPMTWLSQVDKDSITCAREVVTEAQTLEEIILLLK